MRIGAEGSWPGNLINLILYNRQKQLKQMW